MPKNDVKELEKYKELEKSIQTQLRSSKTAYTGETKPTSRDLSLQARYRDIKKARESAEGRVISEKWYGAATPEEGDKEKQESLLMRGLHALSTPLYGIVGGAEAVLGKGSESGFANIAANIKEKETFSDLLKKYNAPYYLSAPAGFALDVAFDPINWATAGTAALIPRVGVGVAKAGLKGGIKGATSGVMQKGATLAKITPGLKKKGTSLARKATAGAEEYDVMVGRNIDKILEKSTDRFRLGQTIKEKVKSRPGGEAWVKAFGDNSKDWFQNIKREGEIGHSFPGAGRGDTMIVTGRGDTEMALAAANRIHENFFSKTPFKKGVSNKRAMDEAIIDNMMKDGAEILSKNPDGVRAVDGAQIARRLSGEAVNDVHLRKIFKTMEEMTYEDSTTKIYDDLSKHLSEYRVGNVEVGKKIANSFDSARKIFGPTYEKAVALFKIAKVPMSPSAYTNAIVGNPSMALLGGIQIWQPEYWKNLKSAVGFLRGRNEGFAKELLNNPAWSEFIAVHGGRGELFSSAFGFFPNRLNATHNVNQITRALTNKNVDFKGLSNKMKKDLNDILNAVQKDRKGTLTTKDRKALKGILVETQGKLKQRVGTPRQVAESAISQNIRPQSTSLITSDIMGQPGIVNWKRTIEKNAEAGITRYKILKWYMERPMEWYERIDQSYKLALAKQLSIDGIREIELMKLSRMLPITPQDITKIKKGGETLYQLSPERATEVALEIYMNYQTLPEAVKVLRSLPVMGAPFACRDEFTEVLTRGGWKKYNEIISGDEALSYNIESRELEWKPIIDVHVYDYDGNLLYIKSRSMNIVATPNHDCVIADKKKSGELVISKKKISELKNGVDKKSIVVGAENGYCGNNKRIISDDIVELVGWFITEGCWRAKRKSEGYSSICITQSKEKGVEKIKELIKRLKVKCNIQKQNECYNFNFPVKYANLMWKLIPQKELTIEFLDKLTRKQLELLYNTMMLGDGCFSNNREVFTQNKSTTSEVFAVLCLMIGKSVTFINSKPHPVTGNIIVNIDCNKKVYRQIKRNKPKEIYYKGKVWCPEVKDNGTWIARSNNKVDINGNSFMYKMTAKTAKAMQYNPSVFNKVQYLLHDFGGQKTPLEKEALQGQYYQWYNQGGMWRAPFFQENPLYLNLANMIPYYTLNMFQPVERKYDKTLPSSITSIIDKSPIFKDPVGQVIFDYIIQPSILRETNPEGMFGQPLYPRDASLIEKAGYGTRALAEAWVPGVAGLAGLAGPAIPESLYKFVPSYRWRQLAQATRGKTSIGMPSKEPAVQRTVRGLGSTVGIPPYTMDLTYLSSKQKKKVK